MNTFSMQERIYLAHLATHGGTHHDEMAQRWATTLTDRLQVF